MNCQEIEDLAGVYALQALPAKALREIASHLRHCPAHAEIASLEAIARSLAWVPQEREPSPGLKARLVEAIRAETVAEGRAAKPETRGALAWRWPRSRLALPALVAVLVMAVAGLLGWNLYLQTSQDAGQGGTLVRGFRDGGAVGGQLVYSREEGVAFLLLRGLEPLPADKTYQVWAIRKGQPAGIGLFNATAAGEAATVVQADLSGVEVVAITVEPAGGSPQPTASPILKVKL